MIWLEVLDRRGELVARHRCEAETVRIGRGYDNDVVVDDPLVAATHLRVFRDEDGRIVAEDLGSANGLWIEGGGRESRVVVDGDRPLRIGHTLLRVREASHPVAPERVAPTTRTWPVAASLALVLVVFEVLKVWLSETGESKLSDYMVPLGMLSMLTVVWTAGWTILSRIFSGQARLERHVTIALVALLAFWLFGLSAKVTAFALSWRLAARYAYVGAWAMFAATCFLHLRVIGPARQKIAAAAVLVLAVVAVAAQTFAQAEMRRWGGRGSSLRNLAPPFLRMVKPQDETTFFADAGRLQPALDRARKEEPPRADMPAFD